jgi:sec-independent protein translocase protein TatA
MGSMSIWHWIIVLGVILLLFGGRGKVSDIMGDVAKGVKAFKKGLKDEDAETPPGAPTTIENSASPNLAKEKDHATTV